MAASSILAVYNSRPPSPASAAGRIPQVRRVMRENEPGRPDSPPLRACSLQGRQPSPGCLQLTHNIPCTSCRSNSAGTTGNAQERARSPRFTSPCAHARFKAANPLPAVYNSRPASPAPPAGRISQVQRVTRENGPGRPDSPPPARMLASRPPTLSWLFTTHAQHPLHLLQAEFCRYDG
jgi:hypothetical protein